MTDHVGRNSPRNRVGGAIYFRSFKRRRGMSGFHLASIGFLGTSGCTALYPGFGLNKARCCSFIRTILRIIRVNGSIIQQKRRALCMWCRRPCWEKPLCDNDCVARQTAGHLQRGKDHPQIRTSGHDLHPWSRQHTSPLAYDQTLHRRSKQAVSTTARLATRLLSAANKPSKRFGESDRSAYTRGK